MPYRLATPHQQNGISVTVRSALKHRFAGCWLLAQKKLQSGEKRGAEYPVDGFQVNAAAAPGSGAPVEGEPVPPGHSE